MKIKKLKNPWLPANEECNRGRGFWVPTPDEIREAAAIIRASRFNFYCSQDSEQELDYMDDDLPKFNNEDCNNE
jgi:hypothetical protein